MDTIYIGSLTLDILMIILLAFGAFVGSIGTIVYYRRRYRDGIAQQRLFDRNLFS